MNTMNTEHEILFSFFINNKQLGYEYLFGEDGVYKYSTGDRLIPRRAKKVSWKSAIANINNLINEKHAIVRAISSVYFLPDDKRKYDFSEFTTAMHPRSGYYAATSFDYRFRHDIHIVITAPVDHDPIRIPFSENMTCDKWILDTSFESDRLESKFYGLNDDGLYVCFLQGDPLKIDLHYPQFIGRLVKEGYDVLVVITKSAPKSNGHDRFIHSYRYEFTEGKFIGMIDSSMN